MPWFGVPELIQLQFSPKEQISRNTFDVQKWYMDVVEQRIPAKAFLDISTNSKPTTDSLLASTGATHDSQPEVPTLHEMALVSQAVEKFLANHANLPRVHEKANDDDKEMVECIMNSDTQVSNAIKKWTNSALPEKQTAPTELVSNTFALS